MKLRSLISRLRTSVQVLRGSPGVVLRLPRFVFRAFKEGPRASLIRLRRLSDPLRFSVTYEDYEAWLAEFGTTELEKDAMQVWAEALPEPVQIAVLMPVFNPKPEWLQAAIASVQAQLYPHWHLCIADDCSTDPRIRLLLEVAMASDPRIQVVFRERNGHI